MSKAANTHTTSRRWLLAAAPATLALPGVAVIPPGPPNPDADLVALCASFDAMERRIEALFDGVSGLDFEAADAAACVIEVDQRRLLDRICALTPATDEGCRAVARSLALLAPDYGDPRIYLTATAAIREMDERLATTLARGMMGRAGA